MKYYLKLIFITTPTLAKELGGTGDIFFAVTLLKFWWFLVSRKTFFKKRPFLFSFFYKGIPFNLELITPIDIAVLIEIFVLKEYAWKPKHEVLKILDLGAHWGDSAIYYSLEYPNAKIYAVEPTPAEFERLNKLSKTFHNIHPIQGALSDLSGNVDLFVSKSSLGNSFIKRSLNDEKISVKTFSLRELCSLAATDKFDLIKFDIEGAEKIIFSDPSSLSCTKAFIGEIHYDLIPLTNSDIDNFFSKWTTSETKINSKRSIVCAELI